MGAPAPTAARRGVTIPMTDPAGPPSRSASTRAYDRDAGRYDARTSRYESYRRRAIDLLPVGTDCAYVRDPSEARPRKVLRETSLRYEGATEGDEMAVESVPLLSDPE